MSMHSSLAKELAAIKPRVGHIVDIFAELNNLNLQLQGDDITFIKCKSPISAFIEKLPSYRQNIGHKDFR